MFVTSRLQSTDAEAYTMILLRIARLNFSQLLPCESGVLTNPKNWRKKFKISWVMKKFAANLLHCCHIVRQRKRIGMLQQIWSFRLRERRRIIGKISRNIRNPWTRKDMSPGRITLKTQLQFLLIIYMKFKNMSLVSKSGSFALILFSQAPIKWLSLGPTSTEKKICQHWSQFFLPHIWKKRISKHWKKQFKHA